MTTERRYFANGGQCRYVHKVYVYNQLDEVEEMVEYFDDEGAANYYYAGLAMDGHFPVKERLSVHTKPAFTYFIKFVEDLTK